MQLDGVASIVTGTAITRTSYDNLSQDKVNLMQAEKNADAGGPSKGVQEIVEGANSSRRIGGLSGRTASAAEVNEAAVEFCGEKGVKIKKIDGGMLYESADGTKTVRTGVKYGKSKEAGSEVYEANFEIYDGKGNVASNYHVTIK